ncbi:hypothetical protein QE152_g19031 [Popillia japonica]|uniref:Uncharacterized protein n=1 Tax=Popillia japonica TaxID=7064 RepID=A0AAW1L4S3_POPJA
MGVRRSSFYYIAVAFLILAILVPQEVEARRKVLRGRRTVTRSYFRPLAIPAWAIVGLVGLAQLVIGGVLFIVLKKVIVDPPISGSYTPANTA